MDLIYQKICKISILSGIIKDIKIDLRNKWRKADSIILDINLDTTIYRDLIKKIKRLD